MSRADKKPPTAPSEALAPWAEDLSQFIRARFPALYLTTWEEDRALHALEQIAIRQRKRFHIWTETEGVKNPALPHQKPEPRTRDPLVMLEGLMDRDRPEILAAVDLHVFLESHSVRRKLRDACRSLIASEKSLVLIAPRRVLPEDLTKDLTVIDIPLPRGPELAGLLDKVAERLASSRKGGLNLNKREREELLRSAQGLTLQEFEQTLALAQVKLGSLDREAIPIVLHEKERIVRKSSVLEPIRREAALSNIGGLDELKSFLEARRDAFSERARAFGLPAPKGICLIGVQGCGKSQTAKAVAQLYRLPLLRLDMGSLFAGLVGKSEENTRRALELAESLAPCVLWIDEMEKGFAGAGSSNFSDGGTTARVIGHMTTWLQERSAAVYVVATANDISQLPPELLRKGRFDEIFFVDLPAPRERAEIFKIHLALRDRPPEDFDLDALADISKGFSGAEIEQAIVAGLYEAFNQRRPLSTQDIARALRETVPLSITLREKIRYLREWARDRARRASTIIDLAAEIEDD